MSYQDRYLAHQAKKKRQLTTSEGTKSHPLKKKAPMRDVIEYRRSQRVFNGLPINGQEWGGILKAATFAPSSCNRHGIKLKVIEDRRQKELLSGILVGGIGWIHRADKIVLFFADPVAYASPNEKEFMHYCDVGFTAMNMWLTAESFNIGASYINPNVFYQDILRSTFNGEGLIFCGAMVFGNYDKDVRAIKADPGDLNDMLL